MTTATAKAPTSICKTRAKHIAAGKFYSFDVRTERGGRVTGFCCPGFTSRAEAVAWGKKWRQLLHRPDFEADSWWRDYKILFAQTEAGMSAKFKAAAP